VKSTSVAVSLVSRMTSATITSSRLMARRPCAGRGRPGFGAASRSALAMCGHYGAPEVESSGPIPRYNEVSEETISMDINEARQRMGEWGEDLQGRFDEYRQKSLDDLWSGTRQFVRENPGTSLLIALATGVVIGSLLRRR